LATLLSLAESAVGEVTISVKLGYDGAAKNAYYAPLTVWAQNDGDDFEGKVVVRRWGRASRGVQVLPVSLPSLSQKAFRLVVPITAGSQQVQLLAGKDVVAEADVSVPKLLAGHDKLIVVAGAERRGLSFLASGPSPSVRPKKRPRQLPPATRVAYPHPTQLPNRAIGYESTVSLLVVHPAACSDFTPRQCEAIVDWVEVLGGRVVVVGGSQTDRLKGTFLERLLPVDLAGTLSLASMDSFERAYGARQGAAPKPYVATRAEPRPGAEVILSEAGTPLLAARKVGRGQVFFVGFDHDRPPYRGHPGQKKMWQSMYAGSPPRIRAESGLARFASKTGDARRLSGAGFSALLMAVLLAYVLVATSISRWFSKKVKNLGLRAGAPLVIALAFSVLIGATSWLKPAGALRLRYVSIVTKPRGSTRCPVTTFAWMDGLPSRGRNITFQQESAIPVGLPGRSLPWDLKSDYEVVQTFPPQLRQVETMLGAFGVRSVLDLEGGLVGSVKESGSTLTGAIQNDTAHTIRDCVYLSATGSAVIGSARPNERKVGPWAVASLPNVTPNVRKMGRIPVGEAASAIAPFLVKRLFPRDRPKDAPRGYLIGLLPVKALDTAIEGEQYVEQHVTIVVFEL